MCAIDTTSTYRTLKQSLNRLPCYAISTCSKLVCPTPKTATPASVAQVSHDVPKLQIWEDTPLHSLVDSPQGRRDAWLEVVQGYRGPAAFQVKVHRHVGRHNHPGGIQLLPCSLVVIKHKHPASSASNKPTSFQKDPSDNQSCGQTRSECIRFKVPPL